jgi:predicted Zn-dependent peptidase
LREEMAAAYVPGSDVRWFAHSSIATLGGALERGRVTEATRVILTSVRAGRDKGPGIDALERAKTRLKTELRGSVATNWLLAASLEVIGGDAHPLDPCEAATRIDAVTPSAVSAAMRTYFAEKRLGVVVIARDDQLDAWPDDLGMGRAQRRDWQGQDLP